MSTTFRPVRIALVLLTCLAPLLAVAQAPQGSSGAATKHGSDRLFLGFVEDTDLVDKQWWEGQVAHEDSAFDGKVDSTVVRGIAAFQPWKKVELGGRMGFGNSDTRAFEDGSGGTDLELWGKYHLGSDANNTDFAVGGIVTVPTGDDSAGLGTDAFAFEGFGALRYKLPSLTIAIHAGVRVNEDGKFGGTELDGDTSSIFGAAVIVPFHDRFTFIGETRFESERFESMNPEALDLGNDFQILGGVNWHGIGRGMLRGAVAVGLDDLSPDVEVIVGYAAEF